MRYKIIIAAIVVLTGCYLWLNQVNYVESSDKHVAHMNEGKNKITQKKLSELVSNSTVPKTKSSPTHRKLEEKTKSANKCDNTESTIAELTSSEIIDLLRNKDLRFNKDCGATFPPKSRELLNFVFQFCKQGVVDENPNLCQSMLFMYKALVMFRPLSNLPVNELSNTDLVKGFFVSMDNVDKRGEIINELLLRMPESPYVAKAVVLHDMDIGGSRKDIIKAASKNIDRAIELNPDDTSLMNLEMMIAVENQDEGIDEELRNFSADNPDSGLGLFYSAQIAWKRRNRQRAMSRLEEAINREPDNQLFVKALMNVRTLNFENDAFPFRFTLHLQDL